MAGKVKPIQDLYQQFQAEFTKNGPNCEKLCSQLKLEVAKLKNQLLLDGQSPDELALGRQVYELAAFLSIRKEDLPAFERHVKQLKVYYRDFSKILKPSENENKILGLYLLYLLASDRIGEFHSELELIGTPDAEAIKIPVQLERYLMEGNYAKINQGVEALSKQEYYKIFIDQFMETMRRRIVESLERSSNMVDVKMATKMLYLKSAADLNGFIEKLQKEATEDMTDDNPYTKWTVKGDKLHFRDTSEKLSISAYDTISNAIGYATEIERIV